MTSKCRPIILVTINSILNILFNRIFCIKIVRKQESILIFFVTSWLIPTFCSKPSKHFIFCSLYYCYSRAFVITLIMKILRGPSIRGCSVNQKSILKLQSRIKEIRKHLPLSINWEDDRICKLLILLIFFFQFLYLLSKIFNLLFQMINFRS
jgi:hypothetical protein